jgi:hypothetical protein
VLGSGERVQSIFVEGEVAVLKRVSFTSSRSVTVFAAKY